MFNHIPCSTNTYLFAKETLIKSLLNISSLKQNFTSSAEGYRPFRMMASTAFTQSICDGLLLSELDDIMLIVELLLYIIFWSGFPVALLVPLLVVVLFMMLLVLDVLLVEIDFVFSSLVVLVIV